MKTYDQTPTVDDAWEVAQAAWETISSVDIEIPFCTLDARMMQVTQCNGPYDMPIPRGRIREKVEAEDHALKIMDISL